jgi:hypothetical protein
MTKADLDLAHKTAGDLAMYAKYVDQLGHAKLAACVRNASSLLQKMVEEAEDAELSAMKAIKADSDDAEMLRLMLEDRRDG